MRPTPATTMPGRNLIMQPCSPTRANPVPSVFHRAIGQVSPSARQPVVTPLSCACGLMDTPLAILIYNQSRADPLARKALTCPSLVGLRVDRLVIPNQIPSISSVLPELCRYWKLADMHANMGNDTGHLRCPDSSMVVNLTKPISQRQSHAIA
jgi:hypothetical protein